MIGQTDEHPVFSRANILKKQTEQQAAFEAKQDEARKLFEQVASTPSGEQVLRYLFVLCGGNSHSIRRDKDGEISTEETLTYLGAKGVWENIRGYFSSDTLKSIERKNWEK